MTALGVGAAGGGIEPKIKQTHGHGQQCGNYGEEEVGGGGRGYNGDEG